MLHLIPEYITHFPLKGKNERIAKLNIPNPAYPDQNIDIIDIQ